ncbi:MAG UNVERIFIED_CONTAM: hypothetical protein LVR29_02090 [Microcystis novacekii LVE1205-3]|jgi:hypothetical protein
MDKMNQKPNFKTMTSQELKSYVLSHRDDDKAFYAYVDKVNEERSSSLSTFKLLRRYWKNIPKLLNKCVKIPVIIFSKMS